MRKKLPRIPAQKKLEIEMANFRGMDNTTHPTLLGLDTPSNLKNSYFQDGVLKKRNGYVKFGNSLSSTIIETFSTDTHKTSVAEATSTYGADGATGTIVMCGSVGSGERSYVGQTFANVADGTLTSAKFHLKKSGSPTGSAYAELYAISGELASGEPDGAALATSDAFDVTTLTDTSAWVSFSFSGDNQILLNAGINYVVVLHYGTGTILNSVLISYDNDSPTAPGNHVVSNDGETWSVTGDIDIPYFVHTSTSGTTALWNTTTGLASLNYGGYGDGSAGDLHISSGETVNLDLNTKHQYNTITIDAGGTLSTTSTTGSVMYLCCKGAFICNGSILLNGKVSAGQSSNSVVIDGTTYTSPSVANGGTGGAPTSANGGTGGLPGTLAALALEAVEVLLRLLLLLREITCGP